MSQYYIVMRKVTCEDVAEVHSQNEGRVVSVGDDEFCVQETIDNPGWSADYASLESALAAYPSAILVSDEADINPV